MGNGVKRDTFPEVTEGPYYKEGSPERNSIVERGTPGEKLTVEGRVLDRGGSPVAGAWLDFWQADGNGEYDNTSYNLRGHQYTDDAGRYHLETVVPAMYGSRTPHIHFKLRPAPQSRVLTAQLFFPGQERNRTDNIFNSALVVQIENVPEGKKAIYDFIVDTG